MSTSEAVTINPSALSGVRFLVTRRIEDLDATVERLEARFSDVGERRGEMRERLQEAELAWGHLLTNLKRYGSDEVDRTFRSIATARADLAGVEERFRDLSLRLNEVRAEEEVLRSVYRSLDDLVVSSNTPPAVSSARLRNASRQVFQIIEEERMRIARDMHDGPAQSMANLVLQAEIIERLIHRDPDMVLQELAEFKDSVRSVLDDTRRLIFDLRPMMIDDLGLVPTLRKFVNEFAQKLRGFETALHIVGEEVRLPGALEPTLFRLVQEAMNNALKHAQPHLVEVTISFSPGHVTVMVADDGTGFDVAATEARLDGTRHFGMISMRERVDLEKGELAIRSQIGRGTEIRIDFDY